MAVAVLSGWVLFATGAWANDCVQLFGLLQNRTKYSISGNGNRYPKNYTSTLTALEKGGTLVLPDGMELRISHALGAGGTTRVYQLEDGRVLRLAKMTDFGVVENSKIFESFVIAHKELKENAVPVIDVYEQLKNPGGQIIGLIVSGEKFALTGKEFIEIIKGGKGSTKFSAKFLDEALEKFKEFILSTWKFDQIGDFGLDQMGYIGYDGRTGWKLFDFAAHSELDMPLNILSTRDSHDFILRNPDWKSRLETRYGFAGAPQALVDELGKAIEKIRAGESFEFTNKTRLWGDDLRAKNKEWQKFLTRKINKKHSNASWVNEILAQASELKNYQMYTPEGAVRKSIADWVVKRIKPSRRHDSFDLTQNLYECLIRK